MQTRLVPVLCLIAMAGIARTASADVGLGVVAGEPTGISFKTWMSDTDAIDAAAGWSLGKNELGVRIPLGLDYVFQEAPFDVFIEVAPIVNLVPETEFDLSGGVGVRFWF